MAGAEEGGVGREGMAATFHQWELRWIMQPSDLGLGSKNAPSSIISLPITILSQQNLFFLVLKWTPNFILGQTYLPNLLLGTNLSLVPGLYSLILSRKFNSFMWPFFNHCSQCYFLLPCSPHPGWAPVLGSVSSQRESSARLGSGRKMLEHLGSHPIAASGIWGASCCFHSHLQESPNKEVGGGGPTSKSGQEKTRGGVGV